MTVDERSRRPWQITVFSIAVTANYVVQVPYALHLYGTAFSRTGALLLVATLGWFVVALWLFRRASRGGYWLLVGYALVQLVFYLDSEVLMKWRAPQG
jgi:hypothetical protein